MLIRTRLALVIAAILSANTLVLAENEPCSSSSSWTAAEGSGFRAEGADQKTIYQFLDPEAARGECFPLYYFITVTPDRRGNLSTDKGDVLFVAGGPGELPLPPRLESDRNVIDLPGYRIVYFHLRGIGFSEISGSNEYDRYLRTRHVIDDIERIRKELGIEKWKAIVGHSYGTVVAQKYAKEKSDHVDKVVLSAPMSRTSYEVITQTRHYESLKKIFEIDDEGFFKQFINDIERHGRVTNTGEETNLEELKKSIVEWAKSVQQKIDEQFGSLLFVIDAYREVKPVLMSQGLDFPLAFFRALRTLRFTGWLPVNESYTPVAGSRTVKRLQQYVGMIIAGGYLEKQGISVEDKLVSSNSEAPYKDAIKILSVIPTHSSVRGYYVVSIYDGLHVQFLKALKAVLGAQGRDFSTIDVTDLDQALRKSGGMQHEQNRVNRFLETIGRARDEIRPWNPLENKHAVDTLILNGGADPVTEVGVGIEDQSHQIFKNALEGNRILLEFAGIGHAMVLPQLIPADDFCKELDLDLDTRRCLIYRFLTDDFNVFSNVQDENQLVTKIMKQMANDTRTAGRSVTKVCNRGTSCL